MKIQRSIFSSCLSIIFRSTYNGFYLQVFILSFPLQFNICLFAYLESMLLMDTKCKKMLHIFQIFSAYVIVLLLW